MLWWSWQVWQILTMGDTRHVWITKYSRCDAWCGCHPPHHQLGGKYGLKIQMWWKWIKLPLTGPRQSTNYFDHFCLWDVCPAPVWHWRCRHPVSARGIEFLCLPVNILPDFLLFRWLLDQKHLLPPRNDSWNLKLQTIILLHPQDQAIGQVITIILNELPQVDHISWAVRPQKRCELQKEEDW